MWSPPIPPQAPPHAWQMNVQVIPEVVQVDQPVIEMEDDSNGSGEEEADNGQVSDDGQDDTDHASVARRQPQPGDQIAAGEREGRKTNISLQTINIETVYICCCKIIAAILVLF